MSAVAQQAAVRIEGLTVSYRRRRKLLRVLNDVSFDIGHGEAYGLVGESGCGKTTVASSPVVGSSSTSRSGSVASAIANMIRCCWPPDSSCG